MKLKAELLKAKAKQTAYETANKIEFTKLLPHQEAVVDYIKSGKKTVLLVGGNRVGKTTIGAIIVSLACDVEARAKLGMGWLSDVFPSVCRVRILCSDWEHHAGQVIVPALKEWCRAGTYETKKNNVGVEAFWTFRNGSTIELMTNVQDTKIHEGWKGHLIWQDETTSRDKYIANKRGLIDYSGVYLMTFTAVSESWVLDDIVLSNDPSVGCVTEIPTYANTYLKKEDIESFEKTLTDDEKVARIQGGWLNLVGRVLKEFNKDVHVIEPFKIPSDWPVVAMIDLHLSTPQAISFHATDKHDRRYTIDEIWDNISPEEIAEEIIARKKKNLWRLTNVYIDPLAKGDSMFMKNRADVQDSFTIIKNRLAPHGILLQVASKDKESGVRNLQDWLKGPNKIPILFFLSNCLRSIYEIQRWTYDENGKPKKENDHFMENLYRFTLTGTKYIAEEELTKPLSVPQYAYA